MSLSEFYKWVNGISEKESDIINKWHGHDLYPGALA